MLTSTCLSLPMSLSPLKQHSEIKETVLSLIREQYSFPISDVGNVISSTDYWADVGKGKEYFNFLQPYMTEHIVEVLNGVEYDEFTYLNCWFQQYDKLDFHTWHRHPSTVWNVVYFLEFAEDTPATEFKSLTNPSYTFSPKVKEGDVLIFPSILLHRSPPNLSNSRKTIIAINLA